MPNPHATIDPTPTYLLRGASLVGLFTAAALIWGCGSDPMVPVESPSDVDTQQLGGDTGSDERQVDAADGEESTKGSSVRIDDRIRKMCDLPHATFDFDSASVGRGAEKMLRAIATCFASGKAKDLSLNVVGHADPRGETEYNFGLGHKRAGAVSQYLTKQGIADGRIETSSRGETEATGRDEKGWARDRRVEILLAD